MATTRYVSVRITTEQFKEFQKVAVAVHGSVNKLVQEACDHYLEDEAPVWLKAAENAKKQLRR